MKRYTNILFLLFMLSVVFSSFSFSQESEKLMKLRLAQSFEQADEWERAAALYEELYKSEPENYVFLDGLRRSYTQLKEHIKAIALLRQWFIIHPRDMNLMTTLGGLYYDAGNETAADSIWKITLSIEPSNIQSYRMVANEMMQHRLYEQCIRTYLDGRTMSRSEVVFADELGNLYIALQQYSSAAQEYLRLVKKNPDQLSFAQMRLSTMILKPEALRAATEVVKAEVKNSSDNIALHRLYVWLLLEDRQYDSALEQYRIIDRLTNAQGGELFAFAQQLNQEHASAAAAETFKEIIDRFPTSPLLPSARFGYARSLEELSDHADSLAPESLQSYKDAIQI